MLMQKPLLLVGLSTPAGRKFFSHSLRSSFVAQRLFSTMSSDDENPAKGFESICLHGGYTPDATTSRGVPLYRTAPYQVGRTSPLCCLYASCFDLRPNEMRSSTAGWNEDEGDDY